MPVLAELPEPARQLGYWPDPIPFEVENGAVSPSLDALIRGPGAALAGLLLLGDPVACRAAAVREAAVRLARAWVRTGRRVILADLDFLNPGLHDLLEVPNEEGVADHFAFGTSLAQLARPVDQGAWSLVPTGPWVADAAAVLRSPGWSRLLRELAESDGTLLALASSRAPDVAALAEQFGAVLLLGNVPELPGIRPFSVLAAFRLPGQEEAAEESAAPAAIAPENETAAALVAEPEASVPAGRESADAAFERIRLPTDARAREALIADLRYRQRAARMAPPSDAFRRPSLADLDARNAARAAEAGERESAARPDAPPEPPPANQSVADAVLPPATVLLGEPPLPPRRLAVARRRSRAALWTTVGVVAVLAIAVGSWLFWRGRRDAARRQAREEAGAFEVPLRLPQPMTQPPPAAPAADTILAYAVSLGEQVRLPAAEQRLAQLRSSTPGVRLFVSPVVRDEALYYELLAGPVRDSSAAAALLDSLSAGGRNGVSGEIRLAPYAFLLGEYATPDSADTRVSDLRRLEIPSYVLPLAGPPARFRVYAGGYTGPVDAEVMRQILQSVGEADALVPRAGRR